VLFPEIFCLFPGFPHPSGLVGCFLCHPVPFSPPPCRSADVPPPLFRRLSCYSLPLHSQYVSLYRHIGQFLLPNYCSLLPSGSLPALVYFAGCLVAKPFFYSYRPQIPFTHPAFLRGDSLFSPAFSFLFFSSGPAVFARICRPHSLCLFPGMCDVSPSFFQLAAACSPLVHLLYASFFFLTPLGDSDFFLPSLGSRTDGHVAPHRFSVAERISRSWPFPPLV